MTPCGSIPNTLTIIGKGNKELSVAMTVVNSLLGLLFIPLLAKLYLKEGGEVTLPFLNMFGNLVVLVLCIVGGMIIKEKKNPWINPLKKAIGIVLGLSVLGITVLSGKKILILFYKANLNMILATLLLPLILYVGCFLLSLLFRRPAGDAKALALGSGTYNSPLTIVLILGSFPIGISGEVVKIPLLYTPSIILLGMVWALLLSKVSFKGSSSPS